MDFDLNPDLDHLVAAKTQDVLAELAERIADDARRYCPGGPGSALARSVIAEGAFVSIGTDHWFWMEYGTPPHVIEPTKHGGKKALAWAGSGHPWRRVHHPGTREYAMMRRALFQKRGG